MTINLKKVFSKVKKFWSYQKVEHMFCASLSLDEPLMKKSIARGLGIATQLFAVAALVAYFLYVFFVIGLKGATIDDGCEIIKQALVIYSLVMLTPRVLLMIPAIINMYLKKPKYFYIVMIGVSLISISVMRLPS